MIPEQEPINLVDNPKGASKEGKYELDLASTKTEITGAAKEVKTKEMEKIGEKIILSLLNKIQIKDNNWIKAALGGLLGGGTLASGLLHVALLTSFVYFSTLALDSILNGSLINFLKNNNIGILCKNIKKSITESETKNPNIICGMEPSIFHLQDNFNKAIYQFGTKGTLLHFDGVIIGGNKRACAPLLINKEKGNQRFFAWREHIIPFPICFSPWSSAKTLEEALELEACIILLKQISVNPQFKINETDKSIFRIGTGQVLSGNDREVLFDQLKKDHNLSLQVQSTNSEVESLLTKIGEIVLDGGAVRQPSNDHFYTIPSELQEHDAKIKALITLISGIQDSPQGLEERYKLNMKYMRDHVPRKKLNLSIKPGDQIVKIQEKEREILKLKDSSNEKKLNMLQRELESRKEAFSQDKEYIYVGEEWSISWLVEVVPINKQYTSDLEFWRLFYLASKLCSTVISPAPATTPATATTTTPTTATTTTPATATTTTPTTATKTTPATAPAAATGAIEAPTVSSEIKINKKMVNILLKALVDSYDKPNLTHILTAINRMRITLLEKQHSFESKEISKKLSDFQDYVNKLTTVQATGSTVVTKSGGTSYQLPADATTEQLEQLIKKAQETLERKAGASKKQGGGGLSINYKNHKKKRNRKTHKKKKNIRTKRNRKTRKTRKTRKMRRNN